MNRVYNFLRENNFNLLHITEFDNIKSILETGGLISLRKLEVENVCPKFMTSEASRSLDRCKGLDAYVRLAYTTWYDMIPTAVFYNNLKNPAVIIVNCELLNKKRDILFTTKNAVANDAIYYKQNEIGDHINWEKVFSERNYDTQSQEYKDARQSEVMVQDIVEKDYFVCIFVETGSDLKDLNGYGVEIKEDNIKSIINRFG
ncbi:DUF4433 domain-containing protein [Ilyobacter polytropus]|uniref:DarT domain-containing protein n=1 Tax=Ilyobacter polytropus (strain ATCC 51220 / DSM 2926 / LMG 16218 / CuHBu1) TaxID=572544 RepID=E3H7E1_ILYPC|nr:DUF4433 domain-containing protein [Ilyobacter polytropus]ADO82837.1 hypothetical protein Ilyop_1056 [Ilyobacter polytropus DSM 2926]